MHVSDITLHGMHGRKLRLPRQYTGRQTSCILQHCVMQNDVGCTQQAYSGAFPTPPCVLVWAYGEAGMPLATCSCWLSVPVCLSGPLVLTCSASAFLSAVSWSRHTSMDTYSEGAVSLDSSSRLAMMERTCRHIYTAEALCQHTTASTWSCDGCAADSQRSAEPKQTMLHSYAA